METKVSSTTW